MKNNWYVHWLLTKSRKGCYLAKEFIFGWHNIPSGVVFILVLSDMIYSLVQRFSSVLIIVITFLASFQKYRFY